MNDKSELLGSLTIDRDPSPPSGPGLRWLVGLVVVAAVLAALAKWLWPEPRTEVRVATVKLMTASESSAVGGASVLDASGYVVARRRATVSSKITGQVTAVFVEEGMKVDAGQVLARIDDSSASAQYALAESRHASARAVLAEVQAQLNEARRQWRRAQELAGQGVLSQADFDAAQAQADVLAARLARSEREVLVAGDLINVQRVVLEDHVIRAPFAGVVTVKAAQPGEMISPVSAGGGFTRTGVATIVDMASLEIEVDVNENFINRVTPDQPVTAALNAYADWKIPARVIAVVPTADRSKATVRVRIGFDEVDARILPDMGVRVSFLEDTEAVDPPSGGKRLRVPLDALYDDAGTAVVYRVRDGVLERRAVRVVGRARGQAEISAGVAAGDRVARPAPVSAGTDAPKFSDGLKVRIIEGTP